MTRLQQHKLWFTSVFGTLSVLLLWGVRDAPINVDELLHNRQANDVYQWFMTSGEDKAAITHRHDNLCYYGQSVDNVAIFIKHALYLENEYSVRHTLGALVGIALILTIGLFASYLSGNYLVGVIAMLLLFFSPRPMGQVYGNLKDIPYALGYLMGIFGIVRFYKELPRPSVKIILFLSFAIAFTNSVRIGGLLLYCILGLFTVVWIFMHYKKLNTISLISTNAKRYLLTVVLLIGIGYFGSLFLWPFALQNPLVNPIKSLQLMSHYSISIRQIFEGKLYWSTHLPWYYLLKWLFISIPEIVWIGFLLFILSFSTKRFSLREKMPCLIVLFATLFPIVYVILIDANLYSGWRQLYFFYPLMVILSSIGIIKSLEYIRHKKQRIILIGVLAILFSMPIDHTIRRYPNHYIYFNQVCKQIENPWSEYEYDYYYHGVKEGVDWIKQHKQEQIPLCIASSIDIRPYFSQSDSIEFVYSHAYKYATKEWDYAILSNNYIHPYQLKHNSWQCENVAKTIYHSGNPILSIVEKGDDNVRRGTEDLKKGEYTTAVAALKQAEQVDKNNLQIKQLLALCYLKEHKLDQAREVIKRGKKINPYHEDLVFLSAKTLYLQHDYEGCLNTLKQLYKLNPKYRSGLALLEQCYSQLGNTKKAEEIKSIRKKQTIRNLY